MPVMLPALADPEVAAGTFRKHLDTLWVSGRPERKSWELTWIDPLHVRVKMPARRTSGEIDHYFIRLGAEFYDVAPPTVAIVDPMTGEHSQPPSRWFPSLSPPPWFGLHSQYDFWDGSKRQLFCFTFAAEYYMTNHAPKESELWQQGRHTVAATLNRIQEVLSPPHYQHPTKNS